MLPGEQAAGFCGQRDFQERPRSLGGFDKDPAATMALLKTSTPWPWALPAALRALGVESRRPRC